MHLVKSAASNLKQNPANLQSTSTTSSSTPPAAAGVPQNLASGTGNDPLAGLTGARYAGFAGLPSASMFQNPPTQEDMIRQLQDPHFASMMREALNNPQFIDMMINSNPELRALGPHARTMLQSEQFRRMMTDPEQMRSMLQMQQMMGGMGLGGMGGGQNAFPAPGVTNTTEGQQGGDNNTQNQNQNQNQNQQQQPNPFASLMGNPLFGFPPQQPGSNPSGDSTNTTQGQQGQQANPFAALFNPAMFGNQQQQNQQAGEGNNQNPGSTSPPTNPFGNNLFANNPLLQNPEAMRNMMQMLGGGGNAGTAGGEGSHPQQPSWLDMLGAMGGGGGGFGGPPDNRPPEERFSTQLRQLNEMGFHNFDRNIQALSRSGGDVNGALEWLFTQPS